jgi:hypothetical protein
VATFPPGRDEVRCLIVYEVFDVFGNGSETIVVGQPKPKRATGPSESDLGSAKEDLKELTTGKTFRLGGWPLWFNLGAESTDPAERELYLHLTLENGDFFTTADGTLAYWQRLTVRDAQAFVKSINERLSKTFAALAAEGLAIDRTRWTAAERAQCEKWDVATLKLVEAAARNQHRWLTLEPGRLRFTMPGTDHYFRSLKQELLVDIQDGPRWLAFLTQTAWGLEQRPNEIILSIGVGEGQPIRLAHDHPRPQSEFHDALLAYAKTLPVQMTKTTQEELEAKLLREAK